eukprot:6147937-Pleurochrysis_carterae.AAC.1
MHANVRLQKRRCAHEHRTAKDRRARRQFISKCRTRARVELRVFGLLGKTLDNRSRSRYR